MPKKRKKTKKKSNGKLSPSRIIEKVDYSKVSHTTKVDQSDRHVPYNLRQSGPTKVESLAFGFCLLASTQPTPGVPSFFDSANWDQQTPMQN